MHIYKNFIFYQFFYDTYDVWYSQFSISIQWLNTEYSTQYSIRQQYVPGTRVLYPYGSTSATVSMYQYLVCLCVSVCVCAFVTHRDLLICYRNTVALQYVSYCTRVLYVRQVVDHPKPGVMLHIRNLYTPQLNPGLDNRTQLLHKLFQHNKALTKLWLP